MVYGLRVQGFAWADFQGVDACDYSVGVRFRAYKAGCTARWLGGNGRFDYSSPHLQFLIIVLSLMGLYRLKTSVDLQDVAVLSTLNPKNPKRGQHGGV